MYSRRLQTFFIDYKVPICKYAFYTYMCDFLIRKVSNFTSIPFYDLITLLKYAY